VELDAGKSAIRTVYEDSNGSAKKRVPKEGLGTETVWVSTNMINAGNARKEAPKTIGIH